MLPADQTAWPQQLTLGQLRELGVRETKVDSHILVSDQLCVFQHGESWLIGGEQMQLEAFLIGFLLASPSQTLSSLKTILL